MNRAPITLGKRNTANGILWTDTGQSEFRLF